jgi:peptide/nickel transport system substrate-binding protein
LPNGILGHNPALEVYRGWTWTRRKEHLAKSAHPNGGITLKMVHVNGLEQQRRWALIMLDSLKALNIDLDIQPMLWPDMVAACKSPETFPDLFPVYQTANYGDPDNIAFAAYHSSRNGGWQNAVYNNPEVDALIEAGRTETDPAKRVEIYGADAAARCRRCAGHLWRAGAAQAGAARQREGLCLHPRRLERDRVPRLSVGDA